MTIVATLLGALMIAIILWDAFETILLPRRVSGPFRLARTVQTTLWNVWALLARGSKDRAHRENLLGLFAMLAMLTLFGVWTVGLITAFALLHWAAGSSLAHSGGHSGFLTDLYMSGTTFFTLGLGDVTPATRAARVVTVLEAGTGFGLLALVVSYLPVLYQGFSKREVRIVTLDEWAGSPPSAVVLLRRAAEAGDPAAVNGLLREWEVASAELLESHLSYPVLAYFRSQHDNQSWLAALTSVLDASSLVIAGIERIPSLQARLTFAMARHALVDLAQVLRSRPEPTAMERLTAADLALVRTTLAEAGLTLRADEAAERQLRDLRAMYEPYAEALSRHLMMPLPGWLPPARGRFNWQTTAWARTGREELH